MDMMIDLETMSTQRDARLIQAGWVPFEPLGSGVRIGSGGEMNVDSDSCLGGHVSHDTFMFWLMASEEARRSVARRPVVHISTALQSLFYSYEINRCKAVWSNGATFDIVIVEHWAGVCGLRVPWRFTQHRDTRTIWASAEARGWVRERGETAHTARADSVAQALQVQQALRWIGSRFQALADQPEAPPGPPDPPGPVPPKVA